MRKIPLLILLAISMFTGCASPEFKGSPFYTGEYKSAAPIEDRIYAWPLLYYRDPVLSILWPIIEKTDEHFAIRPVFSIYKIHMPDKQYNVLWPIGQFDFDDKDYRVFPVFWGNDYFVTFPLYWHFGSPFIEKDGYNGLFPVWSYSREHEHYSFYLVWPFMHLQNEYGEKGGHIWPLVGSYATTSKRYSYYLWPLGHVWSNTMTDERGSALAPLYYYGKSRNDKTFLSLPCSFGSTPDSSWCLVPPLFYRAHDNAGSTVMASPLIWAGSNKMDNVNWHSVLPFYYYENGDRGGKLITLLGGRSSEGGKSSWMFLPLLAGGEKHGDHSFYSVFWPLFCAEKNSDSSSSYLFPFYYAKKDPQSSKFISLPYSGGKGSKSVWDFVPFLFYRNNTPETKSFYTLLYSCGESLYSKSSWSTLLPLYYSSKSEKEKTFTTLLGGYRTGADGNRWLIYPLLSGGTKSKDITDVWITAPFIHARWDKASTSSHVLPFYYWDGASDTFISPLVGRFKGDLGARHTIVPAALSWYSSYPDKSELWLAGGLARFGMGEKSDKSHVFPLYYHDSRNETFLSIPYSSWKSDNGVHNSYVLPLLTKFSTSGGKYDVWFGGPLMHFGNSGSSHIFPLYYKDDSGGFASLLFAKWREGDTRHYLIPPLLSEYSSSAEEKDLKMFLGLFSQTWRSTGSEGYAIPFYKYGKDYLFTPLFGYESKKYFYPLTPLLGFYTGDESGAWLFPLWSHVKNKATDNVDGKFLLWGKYSSDSTAYGSSWIPFYGIERTHAKELPAQIGASIHNRTDFWSLPFFWYENNETITRVSQDKTARNGRRNVSFFPFWYYKGEVDERVGMRKDSGSFMYIFNFYNNIWSEKDGVVDGVKNKNILGYLWRRQNDRGNISMDIFPTITYDRKVDGFRKYSFMWRFFRYEKDRNGSKLDILFIPIIR